MSFHQNSPCVLLTLLVAISTITHALTDTAVTQPRNSKGISPIISIEYFTLFEKCTTMIFTPENIDWSAHNKPIVAPVMILNYQDESPPKIDMGVTIFDKFSLIKLRNYATHCWATFAVSPEKSNYFRKYFSFMKLGCFIDGSYPYKFFIWMTAATQEIQKYIMGLLPWHGLGSREVIVVDITKLTDDMTHLRLSYYNRYHIQKPPIGIESSERWYTIDCMPPNCLHRVSQLSREVFKRNKYFWSSLVRFTQTVEDIRDFSGFINQSCDVYRAIAGLTNFNGFLNFLLLEDVLVYDLRNITAHHFISPILRLGNSRGKEKGDGFVLHEVQSFSFVSCYNTRSNFDVALALTTPFDLTCCTLLAISFATVVTILTILRPKILSDGVLIAVGLSLENSVLSPYATEATFIQKKHQSLGLYGIHALWMILIGTVLTNWYKTWFTMEMIIPTKYHSPLESVMDDDGFQVMLPVFLLEDGGFYVDQRIGYKQYQSFYWGIFVRCMGLARQTTKYKGLDKYRRRANSLFQELWHHFGYDSNFKKGAFKDRRSNNSKNPLPDHLIQPIQYASGDSYGIRRTLSNCGKKVALMDSKENIARITSFLNDNTENIGFVSGDGDIFFTEFTGWTVILAHESYAEKRLKVMISSGILAHWNCFYKLWKPSKLMDYYANWTHLVVPAVSKLDFNSKISSGFYLWGICIVISILALFGEIVRNRFSVRFTVRMKKS
ncbi:hypothetical protein Fcan01_28489 [Folsomia candida]|uniref:Uncharacterized protein n=1 Tax=Folsomia candida TaxID=158441 RepID=A0A226CWK0_FOLCA|nr:hypothetical protein Fcan01_28489 [Folsomia candida]